MKPKRHSPEQIIRKFRAADRMMPFWWPWWTASQTLANNSIRSRVPSFFSSANFVIGFALGMYAMAK